MPNQANTFNDIYRRFEDRYRGSREDIKQRLEVYLPLLSSVAVDLRRTAPAIDLGCGRGEWLELLSEHGWRAIGVDLNAGMTKAALDLGLLIKGEDALEYLRTQPDASASVISAFHLVEHLPIAYLIDLLHECHRVLAETGLLILETPNPENLTVGTWSFYMDPTHNKPLPPPLLEFLIQNSGLEDTAIVRLNGVDPKEEDGPLKQIASILFTSAMDYSVIAQKHAPEAKVSESKVLPFARNISQNNPADRSRLLEILGGADHQNTELKKQVSRLISQGPALDHDLMSERLLAAEEKTTLQQQIISLQQQANELHLKLTDRAAAESELKQALYDLGAQREVELTKLSCRLEEAKAQGLERQKALQEREAALATLTQSLSEKESIKREFLARENALHAQLSSMQGYVDAVRASTSWRITAPLRFASRSGRWFVRGSTAWMMLKPGTRPRRIARRITIILRSFVHARPKVVHLAHNLIWPFPSTEARLKTTRQMRPSNINIEPGTTTVKFSPTGSPFSKKVAVLAPASASGGTGGAERFYFALADALRAKGCIVELLSVVVDESSFEGIQAGYNYFSEMDLSNFDMVISTKAPSYAVNHPNHLIYLVHTVRVFYDMFDETFPNSGPEHHNQRAWIINRDNEAFLGARHRFSIGGEISRRMIMWNSCDAEILHPPLALEDFYNSGTGDYFFMPGRLHKWKRIDLAIRAIRLSNLPMRLIISGVGEAESQLRELSGGDPRIEFLGQIDDHSLRRHFAGALAVPFLAVREDYGYVTLEAFASSKAVITCVDSGEPTFFVKDGITGLICEPRAEAISVAFEKLWNDRDFASCLGRAGRRSTAHMTWSAAAQRLLAVGFPNEAVQPPLAPVPLKVAVLDMQPISPAVGGGRLRLLGLYHGLGSNIIARYVGTYDWPGERYRRHFISPTLEEINVPLSAEHHQAAAEAASKAGGKTVIDLLFGEQARLSPDYLQEALVAVAWADVVVFSHPWIAPLISNELLLGKTVIYDSQNVEAELRRQLLDLSNPFEQAILESVVSAETVVGGRADVILACSREDAETFASLYGWEGNVRIVPNGVFSEAIKPATLEERAAARSSFLLSADALVGFFIGSDYGPNVEAALFIVEQLAPQLPEVTFVIAGGVCSRIAVKLPENVRAVGFVEETEKVDWLHASDFAVNPMLSGSGTNIKMFDFMSAALPIVTTPMGARGIAEQSTAGLRIEERREGLVQAIRELATNRQAATAGGRLNRKAVENEYAWESISPNLGCIVRATHLRKKGNELLASGDAAKLRVAHLSTVGLKCGIGEYTRKIIDIYHQHGIPNLILAARAANEEPNLEYVNWPVSIAWFYDNIKWQDARILPQALQSLEEFEATHLIVQYHVGFFPPQLLFDFVTSAMERGATATVVVHNFSDDCAPVMRELNQRGVNLFSHRLTEIIQARANGVRLDQVPMGIDRSEPLKIYRNFQKQPPLIITTGFLRKHKGVSSLINHLHAELAQADVAVLPYSSSNEGGSAAAADCIASGLPLIVSDAEIFDELREVALTVPPEANRIANAIVRVLSDPQLYNSLADRACSFARANEWNSIVGAFLVDSIGTPNLAVGD